MLKTGNFADFKWGNHGRPKTNFAVDCGNNIGVIIKVVHGEIQELISVIDSDMVPFFNQGYNYAEVNRSARKVKAYIPVYDSKRNKWKVFNKPAAYFVMSFYGIQIPTGWECHHGIYFRDNRRSSIEILLKSEHPGHKAYFKDDEAYVEYLAAEAFNLSVSELEALISSKLYEGKLI